MTSIQWNVSVCLEMSINSKPISAEWFYGSLGRYQFEIVREGAHWKLEIVRKPRLRFFRDTVCERARRHTLKECMTIAEVFAAEVRA